MSSSFSKAAPSRRPSLTDPRLLGTTIAGKYRLIRGLGQGGMGTVYKAENITIGKVVAIKLLHRALTEDHIAMQRFTREARATVAIAHPNIVEVLDMGQDTNGAPFLVMEYVRGSALKKALRTQGPFSVERAARITGQIADALAATHRRGIIHRDLKPENVLLTTRNGERDIVKVVDFGISTFSDSRSELEREVDLTPTGLTMATPYYASPEQIRGAKGRDPRVDIYAVGVMLYEMMTGHRPFDGDNLPDLCTRILAGEIAPMAAFRKDVPRTFEAIVRRALAYDVDERFQSARELLLALIPFGARASQHEEPEPTDTFTIDLRGLSEREARKRPSLRESLPEASGERASACVVDAQLARGLLVHFEQNYGSSAVQQALLKLDKPARQSFIDDPTQAALLGRVLGELDRAFGKGDRKEIAAAGRTFLRSVMSGEHALAGCTTPELFFSLAAETWRRYFGGGEARVSSVGRGYGRLEVRHLARPPLALTIALVGMLDEGLRSSGGRAVAVRIAEAMALGDPRDSLEATWRG